MARFLSGVAFAAAAAMLCAVAVVSLGWAPVGADATPSALEEQVMGLALRSAVRRHAAELPPLPPASKEAVANGREIFRAICARCHDTPQRASFHPPAPRLTGADSTWSDRALFWIVKHGIRNTGMPASGGSLSDEDIRDVVAALRG